MMCGGETAAVALKRLDWDTAHLGFPVGIISDPDLDDQRLTESLMMARKMGVRLVYWPASPGRIVEESVLDRFHGMLVDRKATFTAAPVPDGDTNGLDAPVRVTEWPSPEPSEALLELGVTSGQFSRFRMDKRLSPTASESIYRTWMARSVTHELADSVLVAAAPGKESEPLGMVTVSLSNGVGQIGLIAVRGDARGQGVGASLVRSAHRWMADHGACRAVVVTQLDNRSACRLYETSGYRLTDLVNYYHFWPQE
jgi:dTDP-4-amino-4,6-dideoxy-D-galactose acyltransferase